MRIGNDDEHAERPAAALSGLAEEGNADRLPG